MVGFGLGMMIDGLNYVVRFGMGKGCFEWIGNGC